MSDKQRDLLDLAFRYTAAWNGKDPAAVAAFHAPTSEIIINRGDPSKGVDGLTQMAAAFHADVPDLFLTCDGIRGAGDHAVFLWTFTGHDAHTGNPLNIVGWEEWELDADLKITSSRGWFDAEEYDRQVAG